MIVPARRLSLTGQARMRSGWFGRMVMQVQERVEFLAYRHAPPPWLDTAAKIKEWNDLPREVTATHYQWRDATWLDVQAGVTLTLGSPI